MDQLSQRNKCLGEINSLVQRCSTQLESLVRSIGWTMDSLTKAPQEEDDFSENPIESSVQQNNDEPANETNQEPKDLTKLYDFLSNLPAQQNKSEEKSKMQTLTELLEMERNAKRRRISYKNKVHTKNKSHTEMLRALVHEQMEVLKGASDLHSSEDTSFKKDNLEEEDGGFIQLDSPAGNPHLVWQKIGFLLESKKRDGGSRCNRNDHRNDTILGGHSKHERHYGVDKISRKEYSHRHDRNHRTDPSSKTNSRHNRVHSSENYNSRRGTNFEDNAKSEDWKGDKTQRSKVKSIEESDSEENSPRSSSHSHHRHKSKKSKRKHRRDHEKHHKRKRRSKSVSLSS